MDEDTTQSALPEEEHAKPATFSKADVAEEWVSTWRRFRKVVQTSAIRIEGPFIVQTSEGPLTCADGYLAVDARGYPYPIAVDEFELIYEEVRDDGKG